MPDLAVAQWQRIRERLKELGCLAEMGLRPGATASDFDVLEKHLGLELPESVKAFLSIHDGQDGGAGLVAGCQLLSVGGIQSKWQQWCDIDEEAMNADCAEFMTSEPEGYIKPMYTNRQWIPLTDDWGGNHIGLDFDPDLKGARGQVIRFGADEDTKQVLAASFEAFVETLINWLGHAAWTGRHLDAGHGLGL